MVVKRRRLIGFLALAFLTLIVILRLIYGGKPKEVRAEAPIPVTITSVITKNVPVYLNALGTVVPYRTVTVQPMITGPLAKVFFHEGQFVHKDQLLAEIDPAPYQAALAQAQAKLAQDQASLANARLQARQYASLVKQNYTSKQQAANAAATELEGQAQVEQDEATIETDRINLGYTKVRAPIAGRTGILQINAGNIVNPNLPNGIVTINTMQPISVQFSLPQQDLPQLQGAQVSGPVPLVVTAEGDPGSAKILDHGTLSVLDNTVNSATGTLTAKGEFPNPDLELWPGAYVNIRVLVQTLDRALTVPPVAIQQGPAGSFVYLIKPATSGAKFPTAIVRPVTLGYESESVAVITKGLVPGDKVITEGGARLRDGSKVKIVPPTTAPAPAT